MRAGRPARADRCARAAYITGWRVASEIFTRQWKHVDFKAGWLRLEPGETKNGDGRMFPLTKDWDKATAAAGLKGLIPHDLRGTAVRNLERAGVPRSAAMKLVGHQTESIYCRYAITDEAMLQEAGAKLSTFHRSWVKVGQSQTMRTRASNRPKDRLMRRLSWRRRPDLNRR